MRLSLRTLLRHPLQFIIMTLGIALGVAVMVGIDIANASASRAFELSTSAVTGRATHAIVGTSQGVDEAIYVRLRTDPRWRSQIESAPIVTAGFTSPQLGEVPFTLLGIDPFAEGPFRGYLGGESLPSPEALAPLLTTPGSVLLSEPLAQRYGLEPCPEGKQSETCRLDISIGGETREVYLAGLLKPSGTLARQALETLLLTDISTAQVLTGTAGRLTQIDLILPPGFDRSELEAVLPASTLLVSSELRSDQVAEMTGAFQVNLTALSLLALLVGVFLIYNAMSFSVLQRRPVFGTLRSLGYTREQVFGMVLGEAALIGALGAVLGLGLGILLGQGAVQMVTRTINDLYFVVTVRGLQVPASSLWKGALAGLLASLAAAAIPAREAASTPPHLALSRAGLEGKVQSAVNAAAAIGAGITLLGAGILSIPTRDLTVSFGGTSAVAIGLAALTPLLTVRLMRLLGPPLGRVFGLLGRLAPRNVVRSQSRTAVAVAALTIAVAVTIGVQVMISSFRTTVSLWLEQTMRGDIYISAQGRSGTRLDTPLDPEVLARVRAHPQAESVVTVRVTTVESEYGPVELVASDVGQAMDPRLFVAARGDPGQAWELVREGAILLSEPLASRLGIPGAEGSLALLTPAGWQSFPIAGIYTDYASTRGTIRMSLDVYRRLWDDDLQNGVILFLPPGAYVEEITGEVRTGLAQFPDVQVHPSRVIRQEALVVFDRTFAITAAMQMITTLVAFIGVLSSLLALQLERAREMGVLRALGLTVTEMRRLAFWETGLLGASAGLLALPTGYILAWILVFVINQRSFGWTLRLFVEPAPFVQAFLLAVGAALLAAVYPAWRIGRISPAGALRGE